MDLTALSLDDLAALAVETRGKFDALVGLDAPTGEQITEAETHAALLDEIAAETTTRETAAAADAERLAALRTRFADDQADAADADDADGDDGVDAAADTDAVDDASDDDADDSTDDGDGGGDGTQQAAGATKTATRTQAKAGVRTLARRTTRPARPRTSAGPVRITAAQDVPGFATGSAIDTMDKLGEALVARMRGFSPPTGNGQGESLQQFGVAQLRLDYPEELTTKRGIEDQEILEYARRESRLPGDSLVASAGWCAPSETIYDLCTTETTDGIASVPEINVTRGGVRFTSGPDFSAIYAAASGFDQTEAQAISGTTKASFEVPCNSFTDVRLDAVGLFIKAPILLNAGYPELVRRWLDGSLIAHQHRVNAKVIGKIVTAAGAARVYTGVGTSAGDSLDALELVAQTLREKYAMGMTATMEVLLPSWVLGAFRADLAKRTGQDNQPVTDQQINAEFSARHLNVQFVRDWQMLATPDTLIAYPATYQAVMYPAGTFVKGTTDVINLNAVYDAASLATNIYTALFLEQGVLVAKMCNQAALVTLPICNSGRTGAANFTCA